jgi:hypothetical protein
VSYEFPNHYLFESWEDYEAFANDKPPCFRWLGQQVAILMGSELAAAGRNTRRHRHHHLAWAEVMAAQTELLQQIIQGQQPHHQQRVCTMHPNLKLLVTQNSLESSPLCLTRRRSH